MPVDTLYYYEGTSESVNAFVRTHSVRLQTFMGDRLFPYSLLYIENAHPHEAGRFVCFTLPDRLSQQQRMLTCEVSSVDTVAEIITSFAAEVMQANVFSLGEEPELEAPVQRTEVAESVWQPARRLFNFFGKSPRKSKSVGELQPKECCFDMSAEPVMSEEACASEATEKEIPFQPDALSARQRARLIRDEILQLQREHGLDILVNELGQDFIESLRRVITRSLVPIVVDNDFNICLNDETGKRVTISMPTLSKVVYLLFLIHNEGIRLKEISDYKKELLEIYLTVSPRGDVEQMRRSIDDLVDPESGSLNQKISRITAAFRHQLPSDIAQHYIITGPRGDKRRIILDRSLLTLPRELQKD